MSDETTATLMELIDALGPLTSSQAGANLGTALRGALDALSRPPERWAQAESALRVAARHALALDPAVAVDAAWLRRLGWVLDDCIAAQPAPIVLPEATARAIGKNDRLHSWQRPRRWSASPLGGDPAAEIAAPDDDDDDDVPDEAATDAAPAPAPHRSEAAPVDVFVPKTGAPQVTLVADAAVPLAVDVVATRWTERALDSLAMHLEHRARMPYARIADEDERALAFLDAARVDRRGLPGGLHAAWSRHVESPDRWTACAVMLVLSSLHGDGVVERVRHLARVAPTDDASTTAMAEGLLLGGHPSLAELARELERAGEASARALGVELAARLGVLTSEGLRSALCDPAATVACAASRAVVAPDFADLAPLLVSMLRHPDVAAARAAALALTASGRSDALDRIRNVPGFARSLGLATIELLALGGDERDVEMMGSLGHALRPSRALFAALARFGHPRAWLFLSHHLGDEATADDAADALEALFGELVPPERRTHAASWRKAIAARQLDPTMRLCRGRPWHPMLFGALLESGEESRAALELRAADFAVRIGASPTLDLSGWTTERATAAADFRARLAAPKNVPAGRWLPPSERRGDA